MLKAFNRYRIMSFITGTTLIILIFFALMGGFNLLVHFHGFNPHLAKKLWFIPAVIGGAHGFVLYPIYMICSFNLVLKTKIDIKYIALMFGAGFIPGLAFYLESRMEKKLFPQGRPRA